MVGMIVLLKRFASGIGGIDTTSVLPVSLMVATYAQLTDGCHNLAESIGPDQVGGSGNLTREDARAPRNKNPLTLVG